MNPASRLGSVALTADCESSEEENVRSLTLTGAYDCNSEFRVTMTNASSSSSGPLEIRMAIGAIESDGPIAGPTATPPPQFRFVDVKAEDGSCRVDGAVVCELTPLPPASSIDFALEILPPPRVAAVTTDVTLFEA